MPLVKPNFGSFIPMLIKCMGATSGNVVELGAGMFSTPLLHWLCVPYGRQLYTYENDPGWLAVYNLRLFDDDCHHVILVDDWDEADLEHPWDVALIDHKPAERRKIDLLRLANWAKYIVIHDTDARYEKDYHYNSTLDSFKHRVDCHFWPKTTVVSNFVNLSNLAEEKKWKL